MAGLLIVPAELVERFLPDNVAEEVRRWAREPFDRRHGNCALSVLSYVERVTGAARLRWPRMLGARAWRRVWEHPARLEAVASLALDQLGCRETLAPRRGDVGLIEQANGLTAAICLGHGRWATRGALGVVIEPSRPIVAWGVARSAVVLRGALVTDELARQMEDASCRRP